jgi:SAM-dependent methyltransferase
MDTDEEAALVGGSAARLYGSGQPIWDPSDRWNSRKRRAIDQFARRFASRALESATNILDAGCGSQSYDWIPAQTVSLDRFWAQARVRPNAVTGDLHRLPFKDGAFDFVVCVASVLNYVSALEAIAEIARVTRPGGHLLLHFETSTSFEQVGRARWGDPSVCIVTVNGGHEDTLWIYRPSYVISALRASGFHVERQRRFHILSALGLGLGFSQQSSAPLAALDAIARPLGEFADDVILLAERRAGADVGVGDVPRTER